jgi:hypothetical protein
MIELMTIVSEYDSEYLISIKKKEFLDHLCNCQVLKGLLQIVGVIFTVTVSLVLNPMNASHFLCAIVCVAYVNHLKAVIFNVCFCH